MAKWLYRIALPALMLPATLTGRRSLLVAAALHGQARFASPVICTAGMAIVQISLQRYHLWQSIVELTHRALM